MTVRILGADHGLCFTYARRSTHGKRAAACVVDAAGRASTPHAEFITRTISFDATGSGLGNASPGHALLIFLTIQGTETARYTGTLVADTIGAFSIVLTSARACDGLAATV